MESTIPTPHSKGVSWYTPGRPKLPQNVKELLANWSGIDSNETEKHVEKIFVCLAIAQYANFRLTSALVGGYRFLTLGLAAHPSFETVVNDLKVDDTMFMDLGCCVGQDIRSLAYAGVPGSRILGVDTERSFIDIGYHLFRDQDKLGAEFVLTDIMKLEDNSLHELKPWLGRISIIWASAFLHLWDLRGQDILCQKMLMLLESKPGTLIIGRHVGSETSGEKVHITNKSGLMYRHNPETFRQMWARAIGHEGDVSKDGLLQSESRGRWLVEAWFEDDESSETQHQPVNDWLTKVARDSEGGTGDTQDVSSKDDKAAFLVWKIQRLQ